MSEYIKLFRKAHNKIQEIEDSPGHQILNEIKGLKNSVYIYQENFKELEEILNQFKDVDFAAELVSKRYSERRDTKLREFVRLFHNFIVSVKSLVAHARNFMNKSFQKDELLKKYDKRIEKDFRKK